MNATDMGETQGIRPPEPPPEVETDVSAEVTSRELAADELEFLIAFRGADYLRLGKLIARKAHEFGDDQAAAHFIGRMAEQAEAQERARIELSEAGRKQVNRRKAFGIVGRLIQTGVLNLEDFDLEDDDSWVDSFRNAYTEVVAVLDYE